MGVYLTRSRANQKSSIIQFQVDIELYLMASEAFLTLLKVLRNEAQYLLDNFDESRFLKWSDTIRKSMDNNSIEIEDEFSAGKVYEIIQYKIPSKPKSYLGKFFYLIALHKGWTKETPEKEYLSNIHIKLDALIMSLEGKLPK